MVETQHVRSYEASSGLLNRLFLALMELVRYRSLVEHLVVTTLKTRYRGSVFGFLWTLMNPLLQTLVMWFVFSKFGRIDEKNYALFLLSAIMVWTFFSQSISHGLTAIIGRRNLMLRIYIPKLVFPVASVTSNLVNLVFFLIAYLVIAFFTPAVGWSWTMLLIVPVVLMVFLMSVGGAFIFSSLNVFYRDFTHLTEVLLRVLFYLTPIIYPPDLFGPKVAYVLQFNPISAPVLMARDVLYYHRVPAMEEWLVGFGISGIMFLVGLIIFVKKQDKFVYYA